jgi:hypothetical protein
MSSKLRSAFLVVSAVSIGAVVVDGAVVRQPSLSAESAPYYEQLLPLCTRDGQGFINNAPCHKQGQEPDAFEAVLAACDQATTNWCYTATVNGQAAPAALQFAISVGAYKTHTPSVSIAGYEANIHAFHVPTGNVLGDGAFGPSDRPADQAPDRGLLDLDPVVDPTDVIKVVVKYMTTGLPQYSLAIAEEGTIDTDLSGQNLTVTVEGKPAQVALESPSQHLTMNPSDEALSNAAWAGKCGLPNMRRAYCDIDTADSSPLVFYARSKTFVFPPASESAGSIWASTNATYFHYPSVEIDQTTGAKSIQVKTAAPHFLEDGQTLHKGSFTTFLPDGILTAWGIEKTDTALRAALDGVITKESVDQKITPTFAISEDGVRVVFPELSFSSPVVRVVQKPRAADTDPSPTVAPTVAPTTVVTPTTTTLPAKSVKRGKTVTLSRILRPAGSGKVTWRVTGGCKITGSKLVTPSKKATCRLTLRQAKTKSQPSSTRVAIVKVT